MPKLRPVRLAALLAALLIGSPALAFDADLSAILRPDDAMRLAELNAVTGLTLRRALALASENDIAILTMGLAGEPLPVGEASSVMTGDWSCRMLKLGRDLPLVVYPPFRCSIDQDGNFQKLTGSQRSTGRIGLLDGQMVYLGTAYVAGDTPPAYQDLSGRVDPAATPQVVPDAGVVEVTGPDKARILLPRPHLESDLNILLLSR